VIGPFWVDHQCVDPRSPTSSRPTAA